MVAGQIGNRSMRICYVADGASIHTQRWVNYFAGKGHEVHLICWKLMPGYDDNIHIHLLTRLAPQMWTVSRYPSALFWIFQTRRLIKKIKPDIVDGHFITPYGFLAACSGFHPLVVSTWGSDVLIHAKRNFLLKAIAKYALAKADIVTAYAELLKIRLMELGTEPQKINLVNFGTDTDKFKPAQRNKKLQEELGIVDSPTVISLRSLEPIYDIETLINSIPIVLKEIPEAKFVIAGGGSQEAKLKEQAKSLGISQSVKFTGRMPNDRLPEYLNSADIYVSTSLSDAGLASSTAEAMACGLAVIITDFGDNKKWVEDGTNGFLIPLSDPQVLASKIIQLIRNKEIRDKFGQINRQIIEERNDYHKEMEKIENIYKEITGRYKS
jgi:glycosyltransferase involved in cell wall biosynthesis